jgi:hypothetical protein
LNDQQQVLYWMCPNCGQVHFGDVPPDMCDFCQDFTTWRLISGAKPEQRSLPPVQVGDEETEGGDTGTQLPLFPNDEPHS